MAMFHGRGWREVVCAAWLMLWGSGSLGLAQEVPPAPAAGGQNPTLPPVVVQPNADPSQVFNNGMDNSYTPGRGQSASDGYYGRPIGSPFDALFSDGEWRGGPYGGGMSWSQDGVITRDSDRVGPYNQPVWTTQRPFGASRVYVLPPGQAQVEQWVRPTWNRHSKPEFRMLEEIAIGLPYRFQLDIYERWNIEPNANNQQRGNHEGVQTELRYAFADWGVLPLNPTIYLEWLERGGRQDKPNKYEIKLLLADEIFDNVFYASNLILEQETAGERETELGWSHAISTPLIERKLMGGFECVLSSTTTKGTRSNQQVSFMAGPSFQYRPTNRTFVDLVGLFGTTNASPEAQLYFIIGYQFGTRAGPAGISGPAATRGN